VQRRGFELHRQARAAVAGRRVPVAAPDRPPDHPGGGRATPVRQAALPEGRQVRLRPRDRQGVGLLHDLQRGRPRRGRRSLRARPRRAEDHQDPAGASGRLRADRPPPQPGGERRL
ncbi:MAG: hypothetical protein AVDCRST_MAG49-4119, partial [uncultured Thermomicrobiales bacterium]